MPEDDWESRIELPSSILEACRIGVAAEIENDEMYNRLLESTIEHPDVQAVLIQLQRASKENHLPAFQRYVEREGNQGEGRRQQRHRGNTLNNF